MMAPIHLHLLCHYPQRVQNGNDGSAFSKRVRMELTDSDRNSIRLSVSQKARLKLNSIAPVEIRLPPDRWRMPHAPGRSPGAGHRRK
jgi:hypothetical protein